MRRVALAAVVVALAPAVVSSAPARAAADPAHVVGAPVTIRMGEYFYRPSRVTVHVGQTVRFVNVGKIEHTNADIDGRGHIRGKLIEPRPLAHGQIQTVRFDKPGLVHYLCTFHTTLMRGMILVVR